MLVVRFVKVRGLSPRIRGTDVSSMLAAVRRRFIPAYTGNGDGAPTKMEGRSVYPRVYGERRVRSCVAAHVRGLSPRIRGTGLLRWCRCWRWTVYPRVYRERLSVRIGSSSMIGLSPRIRGTGLPNLILISVIRFIPAYTGNGFCHISKCQPCAVYPRVYGERPVYVRPRPFNCGLSPRIRGTVSPG